MFGMGRHLAARITSGTAESAVTLPVCSATKAALTMLASA
jgi:hypothetical protein